MILFSDSSEDGLNLDVSFDHLISFLNGSFISITFKRFALCVFVRFKFQYLLLTSRKYFSL